jgi:hypothetical protein
VDIALPTTSRQPTPTLHRIRLLVCVQPLIAHEIPTPGSMPSCLPPLPTAGETRVRAWLELDQFASPSRSHREQRKRRRDSNSRSDYSQHMRRASPKRRKGDDDDVVPGQSVSHAGSVIELNERTTLSSSISAGSKRSTSPIRQKTLLRTARPPILQDPLSNPSIPVPVDVAPRLRALRQRLGRRLTSQFIPACLRAVLEKEPAFQTALVHEPIDDDAYDESDKRPSEQLAFAVDRAKAVLQGTQLCTTYNKDENAWCLDVVIPLLDLALVLHGRDTFRRESVQSQSIQPAYLPRAVDPSSLNEKYLFRKTDFCFCFSHLHPKYAALYDRLQNAIISHTTDNFTQAAALFSGIEVKPPNGGAVEAQVQVSIWMAASLHKKADMARCVLSKRVVSSLDEAIDVASASTQDISPGDRTPDLSALIEPGVTIIGPEHKVYYAFLSTPIIPDEPGSGTVSVLGHDERLPLLTTQTVQGVFQLARLYGNILEYGMDEGDGGFWGAFLGPVLEGVTGTGERVLGLR